jgi:hypothetical protein
MSGALVTGATGMGGCERDAAAGHRLVDLRSFADTRGGLAVAESGREVGFPVRRVYFMYGAGAGSTRGAHAHRRLEQLIIAMQGSFEISLDNGRGRCVHRLDRPTRGLYLGPMVWRDMANFSADSICFVLASECYDEADYIRDYECFVREQRG